MCFRKEGILFSEFDRIFNDIFLRRARAYKKIVSVLAKGRRTLSEIANELKKKAKKKKYQWSNNHKKGN